MRPHSTPPTPPGEPPIPKKALTAVETEAIKPSRRRMSAADYDRLKGYWDLLAEFLSFGGDLFVCPETGDRDFLLEHGWMPASISADPDYEDALTPEAGPLWSEFCDHEIFGDLSQADQNRLVRSIMTKFAIRQRA